MKIEVAALITSSLLLSSCSTLTNKQSRLLLTASGSVAGAAVGFSRPEQQTKNAVLYGSLIGLGTAIASEFIFDDEAEKEKIKRESANLKSEIEILENSKKPRLEKEGSTLLEAELPKDLKSIIQPGSWKRFKLDRWVQDEDNDNVWIRQTEMFQIIPPNNAN